MKLRWRSRARERGEGEAFYQEAAQNTVDADGDEANAEITVLIYLSVELRNVEPRNGFLLVCGWSQEKDDVMERQEKILIMLQPETNQGTQICKPKVSRV